MREETLKKDIFFCLSLYDRRCSEPSLARRRASQTDTMESEMPIPGLLVFTLKNVHLARFTTVFFKSISFSFVCYVEFLECCYLSCSDS
jgi:hypothetical protein